MNFAIAQEVEVSILRGAREFSWKKGKIFGQESLIFWSKCERRSVFALMTLLSAARARAHI